jgi:hypothetical protein
LREVERRKTAMRRILMVDADLLVGRAMHACLKQHGHKARRDALSAKAFQDFHLLGVIDDCLSEAEPHRRIVAAPSAVAGARSELQGAMV